VRKALQDGQLTEGQARPLINADPEAVEKVLPQILREEWSARKIEQFVVDLKQAKSAKLVERELAPRHEAAVQTWTKRFDTKVQVRSNTKGAGTITIAFKNDKEFDRISQLLG
jgi:ParB family chromosome partitioning protein